MALCSGIKADGGRCQAQAMRNSEWCIGHDPDQAEARRKRASKGGKRGGRGRPSVEFARLQRRFEELADMVLAGEVERGVGAVAGQLLNGARACVRDGLTAREQEELVDACSSWRKRCKEGGPDEPREAFAKAGRAETT